VQAMPRMALGEATGRQRWRSRRESRTEGRRASLPAVAGGEHRLPSDGCRRMQSRSEGGVAAALPMDC
jgi:hypothetical protein